MFLKQWYKQLYRNVTGLGEKYTDIRGTESVINNNFSNLSYYLKTYFFTDGNYGSGIVFGDGNQAPTLNDYCLSGNLISNIAVSCSNNNNVDDKGHCISVIYTITNNNTESITIGEVALCHGASSDSSASSGKGYALYERTTLETPLTIEAGGVGQVTYTIRMNYPTA